MVSGTTSNRRRRSKRLLRGPSPADIKPASPPPPLPSAWTDPTWTLFATLPNKVSVWTTDACVPVFTSFSEGIVAAARAHDGSALAVADSQVVLVHRIEEGQDRSFRLKAAAGNARVLRYARDCKALFYTEGLSHAVQMYVLAEDSVVEVGVPHPSPVVAFAVSSDSNLVLSASASPPIVRIYNRTMASCVSIVCKASDKSVVSCAFHPTRKNIFVLAFNDGVLACYDSTRLFGKDGARKRGDAPRPADHIHKFGHLHDPSVAGSAGITGVQLVPGYRARAVSVGEDGRLFIVDFEQRDVLASWHVGAPITCLSVREGENKSWVVAVGTVHGMCYVYDKDGRRICERILDVEGGKVLDVEWVQGEVKLPKDTGLASAGADKKKKKKQALTPSKTAENKPSPEEAAKEDKGLLSEKAGLLGAVDTYTKDYMSLFSPVKKTVPAPVPPPVKAYSAIEQRGKTDLRPGESRRSAVSAPQVWEGKGVGKGKASPEEVLGLPAYEAPGQESYFEEDAPASSKVLAVERGVSERAKPAADWSGVVKDGVKQVATEVVKSAAKRSATDSVKPAAPASVDARILGEIRAIRGDKPGPAGPGLALFAPYMPTRVGNASLLADESILRSAVRKGRREGNDGENVPGSEGRKRKVSAEEERSSMGSKRSRKSVQFDGGEMEEEGEEEAEEEDEVVRSHFSSDAFDEGGVLVTSTPHGRTASPGERHGAGHLGSDALEELLALSRQQKEALAAQKEALAEQMAGLRELFKDEMRAMQIDVLKQFQGQRRQMEALEREVAGLKAENERLRRGVERWGDGMGFMGVGSLGGDGEVEEKVDKGKGRVSLGPSGGFGFEGTDDLAFGL